MYPTGHRDKVQSSTLPSPTKPAGLKCMGNTGPTGWFYPTVCTATRPRGWCHPQNLNSQASKPWLNHKKNIYLSVVQQPIFLQSMLTTAGSEAWHNRDLGVLFHSRSWQLVSNIQCLFRMKKPLCWSWKIANVCFWIQMAFAFWSLNLCRTPFLTTLALALSSEQSTLYLYFCPSVWWWLAW